MKPVRTSRKSWARGVFILAVSATLLGYFVEVPTAVANETESPEVVEASEEGVAASRRDEVLGAEWSKSDDAAYVVLGSPDGLTVLRANAANAYSWEALASLPVGAGAETDLWISNNCITSEGSHMVVVYGPRTIANDEEGFGGGARAVIVDLKSGAIEDLGFGYTIAYFNPGCGSGNAAAITRAPAGSQSTLVAAVDATSSEVIAKVEVQGQATSAVAAADGTIYANTADGIVSIPNGGKANVLVKSTTVSYDLSLDGEGRLAYASLSADDEETATVSVVSVDGESRPSLIATGPVTEIGVSLSQSGGYFLTGSGLKSRLQGVTGVTEIPDARPNSILSSNGELIIEGVLAAGAARATDADDVNTRFPRILASAVASSEPIEFTLSSLATADNLTSLRQGTPLDPSGPSTLITGDPNEPFEDERSCAVSRNDPNNQAYQPKPRQVEWAVDRAVKGELTELRPSNWRELGMPSYSPQQLFPRISLAGGGTIPPQVVLGVLMQESNIWQASRFTAPGNTGNPLIGDYYANRGAASIWDITFSEADCGYGVGQITDGMRLVGHERPGEIALPYDQQRAIALDYEANVAMAVRMLGQKWNELAAAGMQINNGDSSKIENWFYAIWTYNTGYYPHTTSTAPWGVGWSNNPVNPNYPASRQPFLETGQMDAVTPQDWPYPEKIMGWAAWGTSLVQTQWADSESRTYDTNFVSSFSTAWWNTGTDRSSVKPPRTKFCSLTVNNCNPASAAPCQRVDDKCWFHTSATWKSDCNTSCGYGSERFDSSYSTEASSMSSTLPALTLQSSNLPNCASPPAGVVVVDDTTHIDARNPSDCSHQSTSGSFEFTFAAPDANGNYPAKVDLHQQGGGFNGHFSFAHMQANASMAGYQGEQAAVVGTWRRDANMDGTWTRVWVHLPDYAAWTQQAAYTVYLGDGTSQTRYVQQRNYENKWVSLGVFQMKGSPSVSLSNVLTRDFTDEKFGGLKLAGVEDIAWDAVGFQSLPAKPDEFVVALGDSFSSGEGAGDYFASSDNNGAKLESRNGCHQSSNSWSRRAHMPSYASSIGEMADSGSQYLDYHFLACSGAESEQLLPFYSYAPNPGFPENGDNQNGSGGQWSTVSQLDAGYLDENTTLVTLSIGGNDMRFAPILQACILAQAHPGGDCSGWQNPEDGGVDIVTASASRLSTTLPASVGEVLKQINDRAPNAKIALAGYPTLFESGSACVLIAEDNLGWLNDLTNGLNTTLQDIADASSVSTGADIFFVDPRPYFSGHNLCQPTSAINGLDFGTTPGESYLKFWEGSNFSLINGAFVSQISVHPNTLGTQFYADALEDALALHP